MKNDYDRIAPFYNNLSALIFGNSQTEAQQWLIKYLEPRSCILIAGGGSGLILEEIAGKYPDGLEIVYVEKSAKMLDLSRQRNRGRNRVEFVHSDVSDFYYDKSFDAIFTGFLFDNFSGAFAKSVFLHLDQQLKSDGLWLYADFETDATSKLWHRWMLKAMYWFFVVCCKVETSQLPDVRQYFTAANYQLIAQNTFYGRFIRSYAHKKLN